MELRKAKTADIKAIAALAIDIMTPQFSKVGETFLNKNQYAQKLSEALANMEFCVVAEDSGKVVGFAHWYYQDNMAFVEDLVVSKSAKNKIYYKSLMVFVLQTCKNDKVKSISYLLPHGSPSAELAAKYGMKPVSVELKRGL